MDAFLLEVFKQQVIIQSHYFINAWREFGATLINGDAPETAGTMGPLLPRKNIDIEFAFFSIQNGLNAAANMSKAFWGAGGKLATQRKPLRDFFHVPDTSVLNDVNMRNNFEHFDERIDRWFATTKSRHFIDMNIGDVRKVFPGVEEIDFFRNYDPATLDIHFWGYTANLNTLAAEIERVRRIVEP